MSACFGPKAFVLSVAMVFVSLGFNSAQGADDEQAWPQFLGPQRTGISTQKELIDRWPATGLPEMWRAPGGVGMSGLAISRDRLFTLVQKDGKQWLLSLDAKTGEAFWESPLAPEYRNAMGDGPRATPTIAGELVFSFTGEGILTASNFLDGGAVWSHDCVRELKGKPAEYGMACSPLVVENLVIVTVGAPQATVAAYDIASGRLQWTAGSDGAGYSSPALLDVGGKKQIVVFAGGAVLGLDPKKGSVLWRHPYETDFECNIATPVNFKGQVFVSAGENHGSALLAIEPQGAEFGVREVWTSQGTKSVLRSEWQTPILLDGFLYGMDNVGAAGPITHLTCINATTGERAWQAPRFGKGNLIAADGKLFISTITGEVVVVKASPEKFVELGRTKVMEATRQAPALADGLLYLRDNQHIICLDVRR